MNGDSQAENQKDVSSRYQLAPKTDLTFHSLGGHMYRGIARKKLGIREVYIDWGLLVCIFRLSQQEWINFGGLNPFLNTNISASRAAYLFV